MNKLEKIKATDDKYLLNPYVPFDIAFEKGEGNKLYDTEGNEYIDFLGGIAVNCLGYNSKIINNAIKKQIRKVIITSNYFYNEQRGQLAKVLAKNVNLKKTFFSNSGAEANECAIKLARKYMKKKGMPEKYKIITALNSFHGRTLATVTATGQEKYNKPFAPLPSGFEYVEFNNVEQLKTALSQKDVAGVMLEVIQGEGGIIPATQEYIDVARALTKKNKQLLIIDEIQTGASRTGEFYAHTHYNIKPDIVTMAKGIGGGYPIGATIATNAVAEAFDKGDHGTTFGGNSLACGVASAVCKKLRKKEFLAEINEKSEYFIDKLMEFSVYPVVKEIRGKGLMLGMALDNTVVAKDIVIEMLKKGFILNVCGNNVLRFVPPLTITKNEIDLMTTELHKVFKKL